MATIKEDYVSFETAKLLTEKGFDEPCFAYYYIYNDLEGKCLKLWRKFPRRPANTDYLNVPTQQMAMKWLREEHKIVCNVNIEQRNFYYYSIFIIRSGFEAQYQLTSQKPFFETYEEATEAAIKYCLENLI